MSLARHALAVVECGGRIYAVGGWVDGTYGTGLTECYEPAKDAWHTCAAMAVPRRLHGLTQCGGKLYVFGGAVEGEKNCKVRGERERALVVSLVCAGVGWRCVNRERSTACVPFPARELAVRMLAPPAPSTQALNTSHEQSPSGNLR